MSGTGGGGSPVHFPLDRSERKAGTSCGQEISHEAGRYSGDRHRFGFFPVPVFSFLRRFACRASQTGRRPAEPSPFSLFFLFSFFSGENSFVRRSCIRRCRIKSFPLFRCMEKTGVSDCFLLFDKEEGAACFPNGTTPSRQAPVSFLFRWRENGRIGQVLYRIVSGGELNRAVKWKREKS